MCRSSSSLCPGESGQGGPGEVASLMSVCGRRELEREKVLVRSKEFENEVLEVVHSRTGKLWVSSEDKLFRGEDVRNWEAGVLDGSSIWELKSPRWMAGAMLEITIVSQVWEGR